MPLSTFERRYCIHKRHSVNQASLKKRNSIKFSGKKTNMSNNKLEPDHYSLSNINHTNLALLQIIFIVKIKCLSKFNSHATKKKAPHQHNCKTITLKLPQKSQLSLTSNQYSHSQEKSFYICYMIIGYRNRHKEHQNKHSLSRRPNKQCL